MNSDLSCDELRKIHRRLTRRFADNKNIVAIGFGRAERGNRLCRLRSFSVCFYVRKKKANVSLKNRIPPSITVAVKRDKERVKLEIPTDVLEYKQRISGKKVLVPFSGAVATAGILVSWIRPKIQRTETIGGVTTTRVIPEERLWAVSTVGHLFNGVSLGNIVQVDIVSNLLAVFGKLLAKSSSTSMMDVALVELDKPAVQKLGIAGLNTSTPAVIKFLTENEVSQAPSVSSGFSKGVSKRTAGDRALKVVRYLPIDASIQGLPAMRDVVECSGSSGVFSSGTSGSAWVFGGRSAAMQLSGDTATASVGRGQAIFAIFEWLSKAIVAQQPVKSNSIRLVGVF